MVREANRGGGMCRRTMSENCCSSVVGLLMLGAETFPRLSVRP